MEQGAPTDESASAKRRRIDEDDGPGKVTRSKVWFADGNLVIQAESTQFRVHGSVLSMHSSVLKDCFEIPQPTEQETVEGCPLVHMPDYAADLELVFPILYGNNPHVFDSDSPITVERTAAMVRLGRKYELSTLYEEAMRRLQSDFPSTLSAWRKACLKKDRNFMSRRNLVDIINLAVEQNLLSLLPTAMLALCRRVKLKYILLGIELKDKSRVQLLPRAMHMCLMGRAKLLPSFFHRFSSCLRSNIPSVMCNSKRRCSEALSSLLVRLIGWTADPTGVIEFPDNWGDLSVDSDDEEDDADFCASCTRSSESDFTRTQAYFWVQLPIYFGLPKWDNM